ncbi:MAG: LacI family transcriptional regulator [Clostridiaceae bacterium]|nr:LacI family transcriptional regulator [Clostridiaceae bacterium]
MKRVNVTMQDVAKLANVSQTTVSLILNHNNRSKFSQETINRVYNAAKQLNYKVKKSAASHSKPSTIMVLTSNGSNPYYTSMISGIEETCYNNGYNVIYCCTYRKQENERMYLEMAIKDNYPCILLTYPQDRSAFEQAASHLPIVTICDKTAAIQTDMVELNNHLMGQLAAKHLYDLGHRNIAILTTSLDRSVNRLERVKSLTSFFKQHLHNDCLVLCVDNIAPTGYVTDSLNDYHAGYLLARNSKLYNNGITAIVGISDMLAYGVMDCLSERGISIPEDVSVIGFDNLFYSRLNGISLTTVEQHNELLAKSAVEILMQKLKAFTSITDYHRNSHRFKVECQPQLYVRKSTAPPPKECRLITST